MGKRLNRNGPLSRGEFRDPNRVCLEGNFEGRPYLIDAASEHEARLEEIRHVFWAATGGELK